MTPNPDQILLPFAEREYVDVKRAARILGVSETTVFRLAATLDGEGRPLITLIEYRRGARKRILYSSLVRFCDGLRVKYGIPDRKPPLANPIFRHKDSDLLPFSLSDTIGMKVALEALGFVNTRPVVHLIEEGAFEAYQIFSETHWRISRTSFADFLTKAHAGGSGRGEPYRTPTEENRIPASSVV